jgi:hypothetical protein
MDLSVIVPFVAEHPQVLFTILNLHWGLKDSGIDYEINAVNNWCEEAANQPMWKDTCKCGRTSQFLRRNFWGKRFKKKGPDGLAVPQENVCGDRVAAYAAKHKWLTYLHYDQKLSHWQAKNLGVANSTGHTLLFIDAHCMVPCKSLIDTYFMYEQQTEWELPSGAPGKFTPGTLHLPVTYFLENDGVALDYKLVAEPDKCRYHYSFTRHKNTYYPYKVPCMSTCGMYMKRSIYDDLGGWPEELGVYGGGENFTNFTMATLGYDVWISPVPALHHYAEKRDYNWYYTDHKRNQIIATYMFGGEARAETFSKHCKLDDKTRQKILTDVFDKCSTQRTMLKQKQTMEIEEWLKLWKP